MLLKKRICFLLFLLILFVGCSKKTENITLAGSTAFQPFAEKLAEEYMKKNPGVMINVQGGGSSMGIQSAISGTSDIGMADLVELPPDAKSLNLHTVARDGIALIVNPINHVENLTSEQGQKIFAGEIKNWQEVGGENKTINIISREEGSGTRSSFEKLFMKDKKISQAALIQDSNGTVRENVSSDPQSIGYISVGLASEKVKITKLDGVNPGQETIKDGTYKLVRPIYLMTKGEPKGLAKKYIDFVLSDEGQKIIQANGLMPVK